MLIGLEFLKRILADEDYEAFSLINEVLLIDRAEKEAYRKILEYQAKYLKLPPVSFIDDQLPAYEEHPIDYWREKLEERYLQYNLDLIKGVISDKSKTVEDKYLMINNILNNVTTNEVNVCKNDCLKATIKKRIEEIRENYIRSGLIGIPSGWATFDTVTGGYTKGDLTVFCARPKRGKTMLLIYSANKIAELGYKVMFISMEMTKEQILQRLASLRASVRHGVFKDFICSFTESKLTEAIEPIKDNFIVVEGNLERNIFSINALIVRERPDIVFVDGAYLVQTNRHYRTVWETILSVVQDMKTIALKHKIPLVCSYQFKRGMTKDPSLDHIALADAIGQVASIVVGIMDDTDTSRRLEIIASRDSPVTSFVINWNWDRMEFSELGGVNDGFQQNETEENPPDSSDLLCYEEYF